MTQEELRKRLHNKVGSSIARLNFVHQSVRKEMETLLDEMTFVAKGEQTLLRVISDCRKQTLDNPAWPLSSPGGRNDT